MNSVPAPALLAVFKEENAMRKLISAMLIAGSFAITGCNTVKGVGQDIESVAQCTQDMMNRGEC